MLLIYLTLAAAMKGRRVLNEANASEYFPGSMNVHIALDIFICLYVERLNIWIPKLSPINRKRKITRRKCGLR